MSATARQPISAAAVESLRRSLVKALSWRVVATLITACVAWLITGELRLAATIGAVDTAIKLVSYLLHERAWNRIDYGRDQPPADTPPNQRWFRSTSAGKHQGEGNGIESREAGYPSAS